MEMKESVIEVGYIQGQEYSKANFSPIHLRYRDMEYRSEVRGKYDTTKECESI